MARDERRKPGDTDEHGNPFGGWFSWGANAYCGHCGKHGEVQTRDTPEGRYWRCQQPECIGREPELYPAHWSCCGVLKTATEHEKWCQAKETR